MSIKDIREKGKGTVYQMQTKVNKGKQEDSNICRHLQYSIISKLKTSRYR